MTRTETTSATAMPPSLWAATAPAGPVLTRLAGDVTADVVVIGAGFTGLSAALELRRRGADVCVVEAAEPGWGASGRNNGQVIPTLSRPDPDDIVARHGEKGEAFVHLLKDSANGLFALCRAHGIAAEAEQTGWIQPVHTPGRLRIAERRVAQWSRYGAPVELLSRDQVRSLTGSDDWHGGFVNHAGGHINPLALARGLAHAVVAAGGRIFAHSPVASIARQGDAWIARTAQGSVRASGLVLATNAYTSAFNDSLAPEIAREIVPVSLWMAATTPLPASVRARVIPGRQAVSDTRGDLHFARYSGDRLVSGGVLINPFNARARLMTLVRDRLRKLWPQIGEIGIDHVWSGKVGMTDDFLPRIHEIGPSGFAWAGCNGRAVALSLALGRELATAASGVPVSRLPLPLVAPRPLPAHGLLVPAAPLILNLYRYRDARELG